MLAPWGKKLMAGGRVFSHLETRRAISGNIGNIIWAIRAAGIAMQCMAGSSGRQNPA